jgi:DNA modification methylase
VTPSKSSTFFEGHGVTIYHGDCREILPDGMQGGMPGAVLVTDPPYGIDYQSGARRETLPNSIEGDKDTSLRDWVLELWGDGPALVFGSWKMPRPAATHTRLIWDTKGANGMGDLSVPWKPSDQEIYVLGKGFTGPRTNNVISVAPVQSTARNGRLHPHEKPVTLMRLLLAKCPPDALVVDPFMGSGSTLVAAAELGRRAIGIEVNRDYCGMASVRVRQCAARLPLFDAEAA